MRCCAFGVLIIGAIGAIGAVPSGAGAQRVSIAGFSRDRISHGREETTDRTEVLLFAPLAPPPPPIADDVPSQIHASAPPPSTAWAIAASAVLPGAGQALLRVDRFVPYLAFEVYSWAQYAAHWREYRRHRDAYRDLAANVARSPFSILLQPGDFEYYERMEHFIESGVLEVIAGGILDPEPDSATYNGSVWLLARRTFWSDIDSPPDTSTREWKRAAEFYLRRAYDQPFRWSWRNAQLEYDEFRRLIRRGNESNRKSLQDLGAILANHMLSTIDAYVTVRLRRRPAQSSGGWQLNGSIPLSTLLRKQ